MQDGDSGKPRHKWAIEEARARNLDEINGTFDPEAHRAWCATRKSDRKARHEQAYLDARVRRITGRGKSNKSGGKSRGCKASKRVRRA